MTSTDPFDCFEPASIKPQDLGAAVKVGGTLKEGLTLIVDELVRQGITLSQARREFERQFIEASIRSNEGNLGRSARCLGVHRNTLRNKVTDLGIRPNELVMKASRRPQDARSGPNGTSLSKA